MSRGILSALLLVAAALGQEHSEGTRELYYLAVSKKDALPPIRKASAPPRQKAAAEAPAAPTGVVNLGLVYNLLLVNAQTGKSEEIDPDRTLRTGDCFGILVSSNRSGYLYVLAKQSSGSWLPLLPSTDMVDESNIIDPGKKVKVPANYCFEIHDPPGTETLFVVLSRDPRDVYELNESIKRENAAPPPSSRPANANPVQMASVSVNSAVEKMAQHFGTRDIAIRKVAQPVSAEESPNSVYVVNTSKQPSTSVVTQINIRHR